MSVISIYQSSFHSPAFDFESALQGSHFLEHPHRSGIELYTHGCIVNNTTNCTAACQDASMIFSNPYTMHNCMVLALLGPTNSSSNGSLISQNQTLSPDSMKVLTNFSIQSGDRQFPSLVFHVNETISNCIKQSCEMEKNCDVDYFHSCSSLYDLQKWGYCYPDICYWNEPTHFNPDIGGIGVWRQFFQTILRALTNLIRYTYRTGCKLVSLSSCSFY